MLCPCCPCSHAASCYAEGGQRLKEHPLCHAVLCLLKACLLLCMLPNAVQEGVERVKEHLLSATGEAAACMICLETIRLQDPVWSCQQGCYAAMHLPCIQVRVVCGAMERWVGWGEVRWGEVAR